MIFFNWNLCDVIFYFLKYEAGMVAADAIGAVYGTEYQVGPASTIICKFTNCIIHT